MSKSWKVIKEIIDKSKTMHNSTKFNINGNPTDDEAVISNSFKNYFIYVGPRLSQQIQSHINPLNYVNDTMKNMFIPYISEYEIKSLKNSSAGWDFIKTCNVKLIDSCLITMSLRRFSDTCNIPHTNEEFPHIGRGPKSVSHQVVATLLRQLDFCTLVNRNLFANHYLKVPMFSVAHFFPMACQKYFNEAHFSLSSL